MEKNKFQICRVCGLYYSDYFPWGENGEGPNFEYCDCCGIEFGYGDNNLVAIRDSREKWIAAGANWSEPNKKPENWSLDEQLKNIPEEFR